MARTAATSLAGALLFLGLGVASVGPARAADSFYLGLLNDGSRALADQTFERARFDLQIACFGLLEEPDLLAQCLVKLGLAEAALGQESAFVASFDRLAQSEGIAAGSYSRADLLPSQREEYETAVARWISENRLLAIPTFEDLAIRSAANRLARMPVKARREELERLITDAPGTPRWRLMLGDIDLQEQRHAAAIAQANAVLAIEPAQPRARCLRSLALADSGQCAAAAADLATCPAERANRSEAETVLTCQIDQARWLEAKLYFDALPAQARDSRAVTKLGRQIDRNAPPEVLAEALAQPSVAAVQVQTPPAAASETPAQPLPKAGVSEAGAPEAGPAAPQDAQPMAKPGSERRIVRLSAIDLADLERASELAAAARFKEDLDQALTLARRVADDNPGHGEAQATAGEIAYRAQQWPAAIKFLKRANSMLEESSVLLFYLSVAQFEAGHMEEARRLFRRCCAETNAHPVIEGYRSKILGE